MGIKLTNNAFATLAASINSSATSITLTTGQGARFPTLGAGDYFYATLVDTSNNLEIVKCTARSTDVLTVVRAQEGTTARAYTTGDRIEIRITAQTFLDAVAEIGPTQVSDEANSSTGYFDLPSGTTAQRPGSPGDGMIRVNTDLTALEFFLGSAWRQVNVTYPIEFLVVAGGGGGGSTYHGGGGGAGGLIDSTATVTSGTSYSITIGAGGTGGVQGLPGARGSNGQNSSAFTQTAIGGGGGASYGFTGGGGASGGSGGGGAQNDTGTTQHLGGAGTSGQGNAGGNTTSSGSWLGGGGGGGAGAAGGNGSGNGNPTGSVAGAGGNGINWKSLGTTYAGGGGGSYGTGGSGGAGGSGGGGNGGTAQGSNGSANTGGGGGGSERNNPSTTPYPGGNGGSGVVVVRYQGGQRGSGGTVTSSGGYTYHTFTSSGTFTA